MLEKLLPTKSEKNVNFLEAFREEVYKRKGPSLDHALAVGFFFRHCWLAVVV
jgi:hypothetical protein